MKSTIQESTALPFASRFPGAQKIIDVLNHHAKRAENLHPFTSAHPDQGPFSESDEDVYTGKIELQIARWHEGTRTLDAKGRAELWSENAQADALLVLCNQFGSVERTGEGDGNGFTFKCYTLTLD
jgi:hypothetical protein